jgi:hypothetical protein
MLPATYYHAFSNTNRTLETDLTKLDKRLTAKRSKKTDTDNEIKKIGPRPPGTTGGRLEHLQKTLGFLEREIKLLECTQQLYVMAEHLKVEEKIDQDNEKKIWNAIGKESLKFHREDEKGWDAEVWKLIDPILERLLGALGNKEPLLPELETYATGIEH